MGPEIWFNSKGRNSKLLFAALALSAPLPPAQHLPN